MQARESERNKIRESGSLNFRPFEIHPLKDEVFDFFSRSQLLIQAGFGNQVNNLNFLDQQLSFPHTKINAYFASVAADFIRIKLLSMKKSFSFETVMSFPDKVELVRHAQTKGYRTYLYYVATEDHKSIYQELKK